MAIMLAIAMTITPMADTGEQDRTDLTLFQQILSAEAGADWDYEGYMLLAQAVKNQIGVEGPDLYSVLTKRGNYTVYETGRYLRVPVSDWAKVAAVEVMNGSTEHDYGQRYFCADWHWPVSWHKTRPEVARYKGVVFAS